MKKIFRQTSPGWASKGWHAEAVFEDRDVQVMFWAYGNIWADRDTSMELLEGDVCVGMVLHEGKIVAANVVDGFKCYA